MDSGFYAACAGLRAQSQALEVAAHNLANLNTTGFRGQQTSFQSLLALSRANVPNLLNAATNNFGVLQGTHSDLSPGSLATTGNPLDVGLEGSGYFVIQTAAGTRYTRSGNFRVARGSELVTASGDPVLGENGAIRVPSGTVSMSADGTLSVNGAVAGKIRLAEFSPGTTPVAEGGTMFSVPDASVVPAAGASVRQGALESSNVNAIQAVMSMIGVQREFDMMQRAMSLFHTEFNRIAANDLGHV